MSDWRPISEYPETDPLSNQPDVLVYGQCGVAIGRVYNYAGEAYGTAHGFSGDWKITLWMPIPAPPEDR